MFILLPHPPPPTPTHTHTHTHTYLVSKSADLGVWDVEYGVAACGRDDGDLRLCSAQLEETLIVGCHWLVRDSHMVVVAWVARKGLIFPLLQWLATKALSVEYVMIMSYCCPGMLLQPLSYQPCTDTYHMRGI